MFPLLQHLEARQHPHAHPGQRCLVQQRHRVSDAAAHLRRRARHRCPVQYWCHGRFRRLHHPYRMSSLGFYLTHKTYMNTKSMLPVHPRLLRRQPFQTRPMEPRALLHAHWRRGFSVRGFNGPDPLVPFREGQRSKQGKYELDVRCVRRPDVSDPDLVGYKRA